MKYVELERSSEMHETSRPDPEDEWDRANTRTTWYVEGLSLHDEDAYGRLPVDFEVSNGDELFAVYAVYSTGDSFGHDDCSDLEFIDVFKDFEKAKKCVDDIKATTGRHSAAYTKENGQVVQVHIPWDGYFEHLDELTVEGFIVQNKRKRYSVG